MTFDDYAKTLTPDQAEHLYELAGKLYYDGGLTQEEADMEAIKRTKERFSQQELFSTEPKAKHKRYYEE